MLGKGRDRGQKLSANMKSREITFYLLQIAVLNRSEIKTVCFQISVTSIMQFLNEKYISYYAHDISKLTKVFGKTSKVCFSRVCVKITPNGTIASKFPPLFFRKKKDKRTK